MYTIDYYELPSGRAPVEEFIDAQERQAKAAIFALLEKAKAAPADVSKHLRGKIYELRTCSADGQFRILYFYYVHKSIILVHAFKKKTAKTVHRDIELAEKRMKEYMERRKK